MKITVLNGSPKGAQSVTIQYVHWVQKKFPQHQLEILDIAQKLNHLERNEHAFQEIIAAISQSDGVLWAFPLYILLVHANYKRDLQFPAERL